MTYFKVKGHLTNVDMTITGTEKKQVTAVTEEIDCGLSKVKSYLFNMQVYCTDTLDPDSALENFLSEGAGVTASCMPRTILAKFPTNMKHLPVTLQHEWGEYGIAA